MNLNRYCLDLARNPDWNLKMNSNLVLDLVRRPGLRRDHCSCPIRNYFDHDFDQVVLENLVTCQSCWNCDLEIGPEGPVSLGFD